LKGIGIAVCGLESNGRKGKRFDIGAFRRDSLKELHEALIRSSILMD
jgi:hypothetical protein